MSAIEFAMVNNSLDSVTRWVLIHEKTAKFVVFMVTANFIINVLQSTGVLPT